MKKDQLYPHIEEWGEWRGGQNSPLSFGGDCDGGGITWTVVGRELRKTKF